MKKTTSFLLSLMSIVLTSCMGGQEPADSSKATNLIDLDSLATKTESVTDQFNRLIKQESVVVDYYAEWCGPCKSMSAVISRLAPSFPLIKFIKINIDQHPELSKSIQSIPTFIFYKNGQQVHRFSGAVPQSEMASLLRKWYL